MRGSIPISMHDSLTKQIDGRTLSEDFYIQ